MEKLETSQIISVNAVTKKKAMALLDGYTRVQGAGCKALKTLQRVKDLFVLIKKENRYFTLKGDTVEDILTQTEESGESLCKVLIYDLFGLSDSQYWQIRKQFAAKVGEYGIFVKNKGQFAIFVNIPGQEAWYIDRRVQKAAAATTLAGAGVSLGAYFAGKRASQRERQQKETRRLLLSALQEDTNSEGKEDESAEAISVHNKKVLQSSLDLTEIVSPTEAPQLERHGNVPKKLFPRPKRKRVLNERGQIDEEGSNDPSPELQAKREQAERELIELRADDDRDESSES
jgi:hypothetical protein